MQYHLSQTFGSKRLEKKREVYFLKILSIDSSAKRFIRTRLFRGMVSKVYEVSMERGNKEKFVAESLMPAG